MSEGTRPPAAPPVQVNRITIVDVDVPFVSLLKLACKSIPAIALAMIASYLACDLALVLISR